MFIFCCCFYKECEWEREVEIESERKEEIFFHTIRDLRTESGENLNMDQSWTKSKEECLKYFNVDENLGLSEDQVAKAQEKYGPNGSWNSSTTRTHVPSIFIKFSWSLFYCCYLKNCQPKKASHCGSSFSNNSTIF